MRVLIVSPFFRPSIGGVETHLTDLTEYLRKRGHQVFVTTYTPNITGTYKRIGEKVGDIQMREVKANLDIRRIKWFGHGLFFSLVPYILLELLYLVPALLLYNLAFLCIHKVDVINAHGLIAAFIAKILTKIFGLGTVMSVHVVYNFKDNLPLRIITQWIVASFDKILVLSERSRKDFMDLKMPTDKISIYTHWVDQTIFKPPLDRDELKRRYKFADNFVVLFVGKLYKTKGIEFLLEAARSLPLNIKIIIIGSGPLEKDIRKSSEGINNVYFIGKVPLEKLVDYYGLADVFILPSIPGAFSHEEGFARVIIESLSCGTPVIVSATGCLPDTIDHTVGRVINPTPQEISKQILRLCENPRELEMMRRNCRSYALERYSEENAAEIEEIFFKSTLK